MSNDIQNKLQPLLYSGLFNEDEVLEISKIISKDLCKEATWESGTYIHVTYQPGKGFIAKNVTNKIKNRL